MLAAQALLVAVLLLAGSTWAVAEPSPTSVAAVTAGWPTPPAPVYPGDDGDLPPAARFAVAGDVGTGSPAEWATAELMAVAEEAGSFDALLLLGDNVYPHGDPGRLDDTVFDPFAEVLDDQTRLIGVLGNHDVELGNGPGQVAALGMPGRWYATSFGDVLVVVLDSTQPESPAQQRFLETALAGSTATWKIVGLHHPPYSAGSHGSDMPTRLAFESIFIEHGVELVLAGHDHDYQRTDPIDGITYIVSGGAAKIRPTGTAEFSAVSQSVLHFVTIDVWSDYLVVTAISREGLVDRVVLSAD